MNHLIKDTELVSYLEGSLTKEEVRILKKRLAENEELDLLYHLQLSYDEGMTEYANELIGEDDFETNSSECLVVKLLGSRKMAADKYFPKD